MREWTFACPCCGHRQAYEWDNVEWSKDAKDENEEYDFRRIHETTVLVCTACGERIEDTDENRKRLNASGKFVPQNPRASRENVGFHWNSLATMSWGKLAELYLRAKQAARRGDTTLLQQFYQKRLALPWREFVDDFKVELTTCGYRMGEEWPEEGALDAKGRIIAAPFPKEHAAIPLRFLSIDVQMDHFWLVVRSWSADGASRLLWCQKALTWEELEAVQTRFRIHDNLVFVDAGYNSYEVYRQCARHGWTALMGDAHSTFAHKSPQGTVQRFYSPVRRIAVSRGLVCRMHYWSNLQVKDVLARLRRELSRDGQPMWQVPDDVPEDYCLQMESEHRIRKNNKWVWEQIGNRPNHLFDTEAIQVVAAVMLKMVGREAVSSAALTGDPEGDLGTTRSKEPTPARVAKAKTPDRL